MRAVVERSRSNAFARDLFGGLPRRYDALEELLSFGQNRRWREAMVGPVVASDPGTVLDVATGTAGVAVVLAERTRARVVGVDLTEPMLRVGRQRARFMPRIDLVAGRAERLPFADGCFDALTFTYLLRYVADPAATLQELARVVRPGGVIASLEFAVPPRPVWLPAWRVYTRVVLPAAGFLGGGREWARVGRFLGPSIEDHYRAYPLEDHVLMWGAAGIDEVRLRRMSLGGGLVMWGRRGRPEGS